MKRTKSGRAPLVVLGVLVAIAGWIWWSFESAYGSGTNFEVESAGDSVTVYEIGESADARTAVFEGTDAEAQTYIEGRQREGVNLLLPGLLIGVGALLLLRALIPFRRSQSADS